MKKLIILLLLCGCSQGVPKLVAKNTEFDLGNLTAGKTYSHEFKITNGGNNTLLLKKGRTSCKCTGVKLTKTTLKPGEFTNFVLETQPKQSKNTHFRASATLYSNDIQNNLVRFSLKGEFKDE